MKNEKLTIYTYKALNKIIPDSIIPIIYKPKSYSVYPTEIDYKNGSYTRYFFKRLNDSSVSETVELEMGKIDTTLYKTISIEWTISNHSLVDITRLNQGVIDEVINIFPELDTLLVNKSQFYRGR